MNKKRFITFIAIIVVCVVAIVVIINLNKNTNDNKENTEIQENIKIYTDDEWKEYASAFYFEQTGKNPVRLRLFTDGIDVMIIEIYDSEEENANFIERYNLDYKTGIGTDLEGNKVDLKLN